MSNPTDTAANMWTVFEASELIFDAETVQKAIDQLAVRLTLALDERNPVVLCVMTGGLILTSELLLRFRFPLQLDYLHATRYQTRTRGEELAWLAQPTLDLRDRVVLVVDDVLDHGQTLAGVVDKLHERGAGEVITAVLLDKQLASAKPIAADFVGLQCPDRYVFGRGMDYRGYWRNADGIYAVPERFLAATDIGAG